MNQIHFLISYSLNCFWQRDNILYYFSIRLLFLYVYMFNMFICIFVYEADKSPEVNIEYPPWLFYQP